MADLQVVLDDLAAMASAFAAQADAYRAITPKITPVIVDSGDAGLNGLMNALQQFIAIDHAQIAETIKQHSEKLSHAHDLYGRQDLDNRFLFDNLMEGD